MKSRELRALARESLQGKWGKGAILTIIYLVITVILSYVLALIPIVGQIILFLISPALSFGIMVSFIKLARNQDPKYFGFLKDGFDSFGRIWGVSLRTFLKMILPILLIVISAVLMSASSVLIVMQGSEIATILAFIGLILYIVGIIWTIIKYYSYVLTLYILNDNPELTSKEIVAKSESLMKGNKWRYFCLSLSFIGWSILAVLTFGVGYLWLLPYIQIASLKFYEELNGAVNSKVETDYDSLS